MENITFNDLPQAMEMLLNQVASMRIEIAQLRQQLQQTKSEENLILARFHKGEIITPDDPRLVGLVTKSMIYRRNENNCPFHKHGGKLYTTPEELDRWLNPHREAMKKLKKTIL